jgi:uncharacterized membrane protein YdjX (TVP38/TMEM64 family)
MKARDRSMLLKAVGLAVLLLLLAAAGYVLPLRDWMQVFTGTIQRLGWTGVFAFAAVYVAAVILVLPTWLLTVAAGVAFGFWGLPLVVASATAGATLAFSIARGALRQKVLAWANKKPILNALNRVIAAEGWKIVGLLRLSPVVPFTLQNYFFGASDVPAAQFVIATLFGIIPGTTLYLYIGILGRAAATSTELKTSQIMLFSAGLLATLGAIALIARRAKAMLVQIGVAAEKAD